MSNPRGGGRTVASFTMVATLWFALLAAAGTAPALFGSRSLGPDGLLDFDPLYAIGAPPPPVPLFDPTRAFYDLPRDFALARGLRSGRLDLWNPLVACGKPLWAEGGGPFFPPNFLFYAAPSRRTYDFATALRLVVAGLGAYLLARRRGLEAVPAVAAGSLFELSGAMIVTMPFGLGAPPCLLPWVLLGAEAIVDSRSLGAAAGTGIALGVAASSGHAMLGLLVFAGFGAAIIGHALASWRRPRAVLAFGSLACLAVVLGLFIAAPALLSVLEALQAGRLYKSSPIYESNLVSFLHRSRWSLPVALFAPAALVHGPVALGGFLYALAPAVGATGFALALAGLLRGGLNGALAVVAVLGVGMTLAPPGLAWIHGLPLLHNVYPMYSWSLVALPLTQAAGRGVATPSTSRDRASVLAALGIVPVGFLALLLARGHAAAFIMLPVGGVFPAGLSDWAAWLRFVLPLALVIVVVALLVLGARTGVAGRCTAVVTALAALELVTTVAPAVWYRDSHVLASSPSAAVRFLQARLAGGRDRMVGIWLQVGHPASSSLFGLPDVRGAAALPIERYVRYLTAMSPGAAWYVWQYAVGVVRHPLLDLAAVRYVVVPRSGPPEPVLENDPAIRLVYQDHEVVIYENEAALPRARIVHTVVAVRDQEEAAARLTAAAAHGGHAAAVGLADQAFIEASSDGQPAPLVPEGAPPLGEYVRILDDAGPDRVTLEAYLESPGYVVLADTFYPGWTAAIDGAPTPIHPADLLFRAVFVPGGSHTVVYRYDPPVFTMGKRLAMLGWGASLILLVRARRVGLEASRPG